MTAAEAMDGELFVGTMSGTSTDGVDAAVVRVVGGWPNPEIELVHWLTEAFSPEMRAALMATYPPQLIAIEDLSRLNLELGDFYASTILKLLDEVGLPAEAVQAIGSRGITIGHFPPTIGRPRGHRIEIGEAAVIAERTGITVISDYGIRDQAAGGHGVLGGTAFVDHVLFASKDRGRAVQNIGGIGNVCYLKPDGGLEDLMAFDTGPGNMLIDFAAAAATEGVQAYDKDGQIARAGTVSQTLVDECLEHPFFSRRPPKSTGREEFGLETWRHIQQRANDLGLGPADLTATMTAYAAQAVVKSYRSFVLPLGPLHEVVLTGGGAYNPVLVEMLVAALDPVKVSLHDDYGIPAAIREAVTWATVAAASLHGQPASLPRITGAAHPVVYGKFSPGRFGWGDVPFTRGG